MFALLTLLACDPATCPPSQTCQGPCPVAGSKSSAVDLPGVDAYMQSEFYTTSGGIDPVAGLGGVTETHDGVYTVVGKRSTDSFQAIGFLMARDGVTSPSGAVPPAGGNEETFCASRAFSWPQFLAAGTNPAFVSWTILPISDDEPAQGKCNGAPIRLNGTFDPANNNTEYPLDTSPTGAGVKRFNVKSCTVGTTCPVAVDGIPSTSGARATTLLPGVYDLVSQGLVVATVVPPAPAVPDVMVTGNATLFVRPAADATKPWTVETYCFNTTFRWPRVSSPFVPAATLGNFLDATFTVTPKKASTNLPMTAPAVVTCPAGQTTRADYCFTTDPAQPCVP